MWFYEAQAVGDDRCRAGTASAGAGPSGLTRRPGRRARPDRRAGMYDRGDHVKFGLPMRATTRRCWPVGAVEYRDAYASSGQLTPC
ncbi:hypothetical protein [Streptosporangium vulgare]|uniref:hypothetical protein n=1 Tax=Streptosporangium vulgare TaxID=46190 RepID=UPI0031E11E09